MLIDESITHRFGRHAVQGQRHEATFRCGHTVVMHPVLDGHVPAPFLRAVVTDRRVYVFDVRSLCKVLDEDMRRTLDRDVPGLVAFTLRLHFRDAAEFLAAVRLQACVRWAVYADGSLDIQHAAAQAAAADAARATV